MGRYQCKCKCHRTCHTCGMPLRGPNDWHINCGDTVASAGQLNYASSPDKDEPWPSDDGSEHGIGWGL